MPDGSFKKLHIFGKIRYTCVFFCFWYLKMIFFKWLKEKVQVVFHNAYVLDSENERKRKPVSSVGSGNKRPKLQENVNRSNSPRPKPLQRSNSLVVDKCPLQRAPSYQGTPSIEKYFKPLVTSKTIETSKNPITLGPVFESNLEMELVKILRRKLLLRFRD